jgi:hypothetical protein
MIDWSLMSTLGDNAYGQSQINIWPPRFRNGNLPSSDRPGARRSSFALQPQLEACRQKRPFASARVIVQHFLATVPLDRGILQRQLGMR